RNRAALRNTARQMPKSKSPLPGRAGTPDSAPGFLGAARGGTGEVGELDPGDAERGSAAVPRPAAPEAEAELGAGSAWSAVAAGRPGSARVGGNGEGLGGAALGFSARAPAAAPAPLLGASGGRIRPGATSSPGSPVPFASSLLGAG